MEIECEGAPAHTRTLVVTLEQQAPGRILARGTLLDLRKRGLVPSAADLQGAGLIHDMRVEATIECDPPRVAAIRADQPTIAFEPSVASDGECCRDPVDRIQALADTPLDADAPRRLGDALGGPRGCSHVLTLAQLVLATARHALALETRDRAASERPVGQRLFQRSLSIDGVARKDTLHVALQLADLHFTRFVATARSDPYQRLASRTEVRGHAEVDLTSLTLRQLRCAERTGDRDRLHGEWTDRSASVADLTGRSALGGMASALFERLGGNLADGPLLDTLLNFAPTLVQCVPALVERWGESDDRSRPSMMTSAGPTDSCYMLRSGGAFLEAMTSNLSEKG